LVDALVRDGWTVWLPASVAVYLALAGAGTIAVGRYIEYARTHEDVI
jgi:hypothetical protein